MADINDILARKKRPTITVPIQLTEDDEVNFVFRALPRETYEKLRDDHPPTKAQVAEYERKKKAQGVTYSAGPLMWNPDTFPPALIAACSVDPLISLAKATELWDTINDDDGDDADEGGFSTGELSALFTACIQVNGTNPLAAKVRLGNG